MENVQRGGKKFMRIRGTKFDKFKNRWSKNKRGRNRKKTEAIVNESPIDGDFENKDEVEITWVVAKQVGFTYEGKEDELLTDIDMEAAGIVYLKGQKKEEEKYYIDVRNR
ncbi:Uncharacterized protein TCM_022893 [Theobroma cacao]|uniref:Uncharacterized protein n=1 Tax=Theobroma cacao TaxID=3641 RepID=A0A061ETQ1_THECC|nr:Uncharacterized protein TCM_022893 [Theobroma cacao]